MSLVVIIQYIVACIILFCIFYFLFQWIFNFFSTFELKCIVSNVNGNTYCIRERNTEIEKRAADLLAKTVEKAKKLVQHVAEKYPDDEFCQRLRNNFQPDRIQETLPNSTLTAYTENKGESMALCLNRSKENNNELIDENTLMFVCIHELSHCATKAIGHPDTFWDGFRFLLQEAKDIGIIQLINYKNKNEEYCGITITDNPYYSFDS